LVQGKIGKHINILGYVRLKTCFQPWFPPKFPEKTHPSFAVEVKPLTLPLEDVPLREHEIVRLRLALRRQVHPQ
jgi:hypothetical protein